VLTTAPVAIIQFLPARDKMRSGAEWICGADLNGDNLRIYGDLQISNYCRVTVRVRVRVRNMVRVRVSIRVRLGLGLLIVVYKLVEKVTKGGSKFRPADPPRSAFCRVPFLPRYTRDGMNTQPSVALDSHRHRGCAFKVTFVCSSVCMRAGQPTKFWTDFDEIFPIDSRWDSDDMVRFWI